jgi:hypothetical protein
LPNASCRAGLRNSGAAEIGAVKMSGEKGDSGSGMIRPTAWPAHKPAVEVRHRCEVVATTRQGVIDQLIEVLNVEGYFVSKKVQWEKTSAFRKRLDGMCHEALHRALRHPACPPVELHRARGGSGQLLAINSNPVFEAFILALRGKKQERKPPSPRTIAEGRPSRRKPANQLQRSRMRGPKRNYAT